MSRLINIIKNTFAVIGVVNTAYAMKYLIKEYNEYNENNKKNEKDELIEKLNEKIKYVENVTQRIDHIQYTLSELKNILDDRNKSDSPCEFYGNQFDEDVFY
jgi:predicted nuclease with TOPRIM domain